MELALESYEQKQKRYKIIMFILTAVMIAMFFSFVSNVHQIIKKETPYILENCEWEMSGDRSLMFVPNFVNSEEKAIEEAKRLYGKGDYIAEKEYEPCEGWIVSKIEKNVTQNKILLCRNGYVYHYKKICEKSGLFDSLLKLLQML